MPSNGDVSDRAPLAPAPLLTAMQLLAARDVYGLVWLGDDLVVDSIYGRLVDFVAIGEPVTDSIYALVGLEDDIRAMRGRSSDVMDLPEISLVTQQGRQPRANLSVYWCEEAQGFILLVARTGSRSELEIELIAQMRARLMAESELAAKTRQLEVVNEDLQRANADLEAFASIISHDLQSPMRALRYMVDEIEAVIGPSAKGEVVNRLEALRAQSRRMTGMLTALLDYSSVTRKSDAVERVDTDQLIRAIVSSIGVPAGFEIIIKGTWPTLDTVAAPLDLVLRNLVDNALKHHDRDTGTVRLTAVCEPDAVKFEVADDGPGIRPEHRNAVFLPFRTLAQNGAPGQGMGLALVRRTIEGVGGRIALASAAPEGRGTIVTINWPR